MTEHQRRKNPDMLPEVMEHPEMMGSEAKWKQDGIIRKCTNMNNPEMMKHEWHDGNFADMTEHERRKHPDMFPEVLEYPEMMVWEEKLKQDRFSRKCVNMNNPETMKYEWRKFAEMTEHLRMFPEWQARSKPLQRDWRIRGTRSKWLERD